MYKRQILDGAGNLFGTTAGGLNPGTVFQLIPPTSVNGKWRAKVLHTFCLFFPCGDGDGIAPESGLIFDRAGNLYGTTVAGGAFGLGAVFELSPSPTGNWTEKVIYSFRPFGTNDGTNPYGTLALDASGNLYGTTAFGGSKALGTVFELTPQPDGTWTEAILYNFCSLPSCSDGLQPHYGLVLDPSGNLYGVTPASSATSGGLVFKLTHDPSGNWTESVLHVLNGGSDGSLPSGELIFDALGNLYGVAGGGGANNFGAAFELKPSAGGWRERVLYNFADSGDGSNPRGGLLLDKQGNLFGTATQDNDPNNCSKGCGAVFEIVR